MMAEAPPHIGTIVALFAKKDKRARLLYLASKEARRGDFCDALLHDTRSLDLTLAKRLGPPAADVDAVLRGLGAKAHAPAYAVSDISEIDGRELPLGEALRAAVGRQRDTIVLCIGTKRAFYENHEGEQLVFSP